MWILENLFFDTVFVKVFFKSQLTNEVLFGSIVVRRGCTGKPCGFVKSGLDGHGP